MQAQKKAIGVALQVDFMESLWAFAEAMRQIHREANARGWATEDLDVKFEVKVANKKEQPNLIVSLADVRRDS